MDRQHCQGKISHSKKGSKWSPRHCRSVTNLHQPLSIPAKYACTCSSHPFSESDLAKHIPKSTNVFKHLLGSSQWWLRRFPVTSYKYSGAAERPGKVRDLLLERKTKSNRIRNQIYPKAKGRRKSMCENFGCFSSAGTLQGEETKSNSCIQKPSQAGLEEDPDCLTDLSVLLICPG